LSFVLLPALSRVYMQIASGQQPYLPPVPTSMRDFAKAFREYMSKPELWTRGLEYWTKITPDQFLCIPPDKSGTEIGFFKFAEKSISPTKVKQIKQVATTNKVSPLSIVIFALLQFFGVQQNKWEGFVELVTSGRNAIPTMDLKRTIGFIASTTLEYFSINSKAPLEVNLQGIHHVLNLMRKRDSESLAFMEGPHGNNLKQMCKSNVVVNYMPSLSQLIPELFSPFFESGINYSRARYLDFPITYEGPKWALYIFESPNDGSWLILFGHLNSWFSDQMVEETSTKFISQFDSVLLPSL